jgi:hypothetical protein
VATSPISRPFYGTIWFNILATAVAVLVIFAAATSMPILQGRPTRGFGQFGVVLVAIYWVLVFPKLRKIHQDSGKSGSANR